MPHQIRKASVVTLTLLGALAGPLAGLELRAPSDTGAPAAAPAPPPSFKLSGFAEASYVYSSQKVAPNIIVGRLYDRYSNAFTLNALKVTADLPFDPKKTSAGVHADVMAGQNAEVLHSSGPGGPFGLGPDGEIEQLYVTLNMPTGNGNGVQLKIGKMVTMLGLEVIEDVANPVWSEGNQFTYVENFTSTGVELDLKPSGAIDVELRADNGWDRVTVTDNQKSFMGRIGISGAKTTLGITAFYGNLEPGITGAPRYGVEGLLNQKAGKASFWVQADYGKEKANAALFDPTQDASWWAVGGWAAVDASSTLNLSARADYLDDAEAARTGAAFGVTGPGAHKLWTLTGDLNVKTWANVLVRPEVRYDHSNFTVFNGNADQFSGALSVAYTF
jgi:Putative beta-barrel porin-2, OmpL-like. bbp2